MFRPIDWLLETSDFVPRWTCGNWSDWLGWLHIASDLTIWIAYLAIPVVLIWFVRRRRDVPFPRLFWLFGLFIVSCGFTHLIDAVIFYEPVYRLAGVVKLFTAVASWAAVIALIPVVPRVLAMRTPQDLESEVARRTADLAAANAELRREVGMRKQAEEEMQAAEQRLTLAVKAAEMGIWEWDATTDGLYWSSACYTALGVRPGEVEISTAGFNSLLHPDDRERVWVACRTAIADRTPYEAEFRILPPSGEVRWVANHGRAVVSQMGNSVRLVGTVIDITARKRTEEATRDALERLRAVVEQAVDGIITIDERGTVESVNPAVGRVFGYAPAEVVGRNVSMLMPEPFRGEHDTYLANYLRTGHAKVIGIGREVTGRRKDGTEFPVELSVSEARLTGGRLFTGIVRDVSARKHAEEAILRSEARFRQLADAMPQIVWTARPEGRRDYFNRQWYELTGATDVETGDTSWLTNLHPDDRQRSQSTWYESVRNEQPYQIEHRFRFPGSGEYRWYLGRALPVRDDSGLVVRWFGTCTDIHDQKLAEEALHREREFLRAVLENIAEGVIACDSVGRLTLSNRAARDIHGCGADPLPTEGWAERYPRFWPDGTVIGYDDLPIIRALRGDRVRDEEFAITRPDGERRTVIGSGEPLSDSVGNRIGAVLAIHDITNRKQAEEELRRRDRAIQAASQGLLITDPDQSDNPIVYASPGFERLTGYPAAEIVGRNCRFLQGKDTDPAVVSQVRRAVQSGHVCSVELLNYRKDGTTFWNALSITPVRDGDRVTHFVGVQTDVTERRKLEDQLRQAQKMEAVGQLAGGVAHDFNNLLTVINGYSELLLEVLPNSDPSWAAITAIRESGERATGLTSQLLAFSRQAVLEAKVLDLNVVVSETGRMLRRLIGEDVSLTLTLALRVSRVRVDPGQFGQVLMNLAVNARDAMPTGGQLTIETRDADLDEEYARMYPGVRPGRYVMTAVTDTGVGMPPDVKARVFEPFFTTKGPGKGTGLGLATVYGIVKQSGGHIDLYSEVGVGTTFKIYLPAVDQDHALLAEVDLGSVKGGPESVLLVEDQEDVRRLARVALESYGYSVMDAADGPAALRLIERDRPRLDLLVTDVVMPEMGGRMVAEAVRAMYPGLPVLFVSGYTDDAVVRHGILQAEVQFLRKPYTPLSLARKVREILDR